MYRFIGIFDKLTGLFLTRALCVILLGAILPCGAGAQQKSVQQRRPPAREGTVRLEAGQQRKEGDVFFADGNVDIHYLDYRLRADHVHYDAKTYLAKATGHVQLDVNTEHLTADSGDFNVQTGEGHFQHVRGEVKAEHLPNPNLLISPNPLVFEGREVTRVDDRTYEIEDAWLTVCEPEKPSWKFYSTHTTLNLDHDVVMLNANFRMFRIPLVYLPYATVPVGRDMRQSGFLLPVISDTNLKGVVLGDGYYWAPRNWTDVALGGEYLSKRGWQENAELRAKPWQNVDISTRYFGVMDRGLTAIAVNPMGLPVNTVQKQGGHSVQFKLDARLLDGWHAVVDFNQLTSEVFQLAFSPTFGQAVNSEVRTSAFLTNSFHGFTVDFSGQNYKVFQNAEPQVDEIIRTAPQVQIGSVDQAPWAWLPVYFGGDAFAGAVHRSDENLVTNPVTGYQYAQGGIDTSGAVERSELAPRVVIPLHWGPWIGMTTTYTVRATSYGAQINDGDIVDHSLLRTTGELSIDLRPPTFDRVWGKETSRWKHTIEPQIVYSYVRGVNQFDHFIRFDQDETLTDTNEFLYAVTQRLLHRGKNGQASELLSWKIAQKYYFDPTFNGALVPGARNVFQALDSITPFAFADEPRRFSPIDSDVRLTPGGIYDAEVRLDYDTLRQKLTTAGTLLKIQPSQKINFTLAHFSIDNSAVLQPLANQIRAQVAYGALTRRGWNVAAGFSYDVRQQILQSQLVQIAYNGSCCGIALEYRRLTLLPVRTENQFRVSFNIANIGTFGNLRQQEKLF